MRKVDLFDAPPELHYGCREIMWYDRDFYVCSFDEDITQLVKKIPSWFVLFYRDQPRYGSFVAHVNSHEMYLDAGRFAHFSRAMLGVECRIDLPDLPDLSRINDLVTILGEMEVPWSYRCFSRGRTHSPTFVFNSVADAVAFKLQAV